MIIFGSGCGASTTDGPTTTEGSGGSPEPALGVIITETDALTLCEGLFDPPPEGYWTPEWAQVAEFEASIAEFLSGAAPDGSRLRGGLEGYQAQYVGIFRGDREVIFANFFCQSHIDDLTQTMVVVDGGGDCYFTIEYDPASGEFDATWPGDSE